MQPATKDTNYPQYREIPYCEPFTAFAPFADEIGAVLIDCPIESESSRYAYVCAHPQRVITAKNSLVTVDKLSSSSTYEANPFDLMRQTLTDYHQTTLPELPPFQGGMAGFLSYDLSHNLEELPRAEDDMQFPDLCLGVYDVVLAFDVKEQRAWVVVNGYPEGNYDKSWEKAEQMLSKLCSAYPTLQALPQPVDLASNFPDRDSYERSIQQVIDYILEGDIFEANLTRRLQGNMPDNITEYQLYGLLRQYNPAPFACYMNFGETKIASSSPERFIKLNNGLAETFPIKGTRPRGKTPADDDRLAQELVQSEKDRAENLMIVDLMRNDFSRVCLPGTVKTPEVCGLYSFATVHHLISKVEGRLCPGVGPIELLEATFPGGSITGAPKIRAMEIIAELEPTARGPYCGSAGFIGFDGNMDTNILIRTFAIKDKRICFQAGGAIVLDSDPEEEYDETDHKFAALKKVLG